VEGKMSKNLEAEGADSVGFQAQNAQIEGRQETGLERLK
jgi:hypothetical protein